MEGSRMTREEAITWLENRAKQIPLPGALEVYRMAIAALRELDAQEKQESFGEWISVKERLPDDEQEVLVIAHGWDGRLVYVGSHRRVEAQKSWLTGITSKSSEWSLWGWSYLKEPIVTHWLPMPEPPEEEKR